MQVILKFIPIGIIYHDLQTSWKLLKLVRHSVWQNDASYRAKFCQTSSCSTAGTCFILASYENARKPPFWHTDLYNNVDTYSLSACTDSHVKGLYDWNRLNCNTKLESLLCTCNIYSITFWIFVFDIRTDKILISVRHLKFLSVKLTKLALFRNTGFGDILSLFM